MFKAFNHVEYIVTSFVTMSTFLLQLSRANRIVRLSSERLKASAKGQVALSERQMKIVEHLNRNPFITVGDMAKMFQITRQAALKEIGKLVDLEVVRLVGQKRGARYILS